LVFAWCDRRRITQLARIEPLHVAAYIEGLQETMAKPTVKPAYLEGGGTLENAQLMAAHESPRTTKLYDRTCDEITLDEVERIAI
jgi:hypothetical protein